MLKTTKYRKIKNLNICSMDWKKSIFFKWMYKFNTSPIKILRKKNLSIKEIILKFMWKSEEAEPTLRKQDRVEGLTVRTLNSLRGESDKDPAGLAHRSLAQGWTHRAMGQTCRCCCRVASVAPDAVWPHRQQPTRLPRPCDAPGKNAGVRCHFLLQGMEVKEQTEEPRKRLTEVQPTDLWQSHRSGSEEEEQSFQPAVLKGLNIHKKKNKAWPKPYFSYKITSKYVGLNVKSKTIKLLKENIKGNLWVLGFGEEF